VDKFQGQAKVCILSLCSSYGECGWRGLAFILDRNRINVAISRAQCLAVVVADRRIASTAASSIDDEMTLIKLVRERGLEPPPLSGPDPKSGVSAIPPLAQPGNYESRIRN
jgi:hypothetical protein